MNSTRSTEPDVAVIDDDRPVPIEQNARARALIDKAADRVRAPSLRILCRRPQAEVRGVRPRAADRSVRVLARGKPPQLVRAALRRTDTWSLTIPLWPVTWDRRYSRSQGRYLKEFRRDGRPGDRPAPHGRRRGPGARSRYRRTPGDGPAAPGVEALDNQRDLLKRSVPSSVKELDRRAATGTSPP